MIQTIKKGWHRSLPIFFPVVAFWKTTQLKFTLTESMWYDPATCTGWNKLGGFTSIRVHNNSDRLAWRPTYRGRFRIASYKYVDGKVIIGEETIVSAGEAVHISNFNRYWFLANFYFGGKDKSPKDMKLIVNKL